MLISIPDDADPMMEWFFLFSGSATTYQSQALNFLQYRTVRGEGSGSNSVRRIT